MNARSRVSIGALLFGATRIASGGAAALPPPLPQGDVGLAARYVEDVGIERDPAVLLVDGFESATPGNPGKTWENAWGGPEKLRVATEASGVHRGGPLPRDDARAAQSGTGDGLRNDEVAVPGSRHPLPALLCALREAYRGLPRWGEQFFPSGDRLPRGARGRAKFGPHFVERPHFVPERDRWYCYELMVQANAPGVRDGRIAYWVDGKLVADFPGLRLRDVPELELNRVNLGLYTHNERVQKTIVMSYDDVVLASSYIGPVFTREKATAAAAKKKPRPVTRPAPKPRAPTIAPEALAPWEAKLVARVCAFVDAGGQPAIRLKLPGMGSRSSTVVACDERSLSIVAGGLNASLPWTGLSARERMGLALAVLREGDCDDHLLAAVFALAAHEADAARQHFDAARAADPERGEARVAAARTSLGL
jgi:hypothetical protein